MDVARTLSPLERGHSDPTLTVDRVTGDRWLAVRNDQGDATLCIRPVTEGARIVAFGRGSDRAIELAPELLGRGDDWSGLDLRRVPWLAEVRRRHPGLRLCRTNAVFPAIAQAIIEQRVTGTEAHGAWAWLHRRYADRAPGPTNLVPRGLLLPLTPRQWLGIPSWDWHRAGVDHARSTALLRAAAVADGLERTLRLGRGSDEITARLRSVPGVGVWTAAETTQRSHGDPDAPSFGDFHVAHWVGYALRGERTDDVGMRDLLEPWRGHRQRVVRLIALSDRRREPRRAPRLEPADHRRR
ncbi:DNA-3-methyladenine glycosylase 2 family protein [Pseudoclavibacter endophyticus]|uniref:DNA-3-methyladenine glycosylase 2 family protein n=1 Tax=Pseudoclavibacter endophyticus TaxID=1778590 RepID=A0A6H9WUA9_9MICO|nr:DNA-3-methyladenine glycosylase 2 family protein [Pseudoclavibacter endophyticus]